MDSSGDEIPELIDLEKDERKTRKRARANRPLSSSEEDDGGEGYAKAKYGDPEVEESNDEGEINAEDAGNTPGDALPSGDSEKAGIKKGTKSRPYRPKLPSWGQKRKSVEPDNEDGLSKHQEALLQHVGMANHGYSQRKHV